MLRCEEIRAIGADLGLGSVIDGLIDVLVPAYRLEASEGGAHQIGGEPDLLAGEVWPTNERGVALTFIAQINVGACQALPTSGLEIEAWRSHARLLRLFADLYDHPFSPNPVVALVGDQAADRVRATTPERPPAVDQDPDHPYAIAALKEVTVDAVPCWTFDVRDPAVVAASEIDHGRSVENAPVLELSHRLHAGRHLERGWHVLPQLLGEPTPVQEDPRWVYVDGGPDAPPAGPEHWALLLQVDDSFASYGDGGGLFIVAPSADLAAGRYDRLRVETQSM